jgi:hypothetical protein
VKDKMIPIARAVLLSLLAKNIIIMQKTKSNLKSRVRSAADYFSDNEAIRKTPCTYNI